MKNKKIRTLILALPPLAFALLYGGGYAAQFIRNYHIWTSAGGTPGGGTSPQMPSFAVGSCLKAIFTWPYGIAGALICILVFGLLLIMVMKMGYGEKGEYDKDRNFIYSNKGTYGTAGFMSRKEAEEVLQFIKYLLQAQSIIGMRYCLVETENSEENEKVINFYKNYGFTFLKIDHADEYQQLILRLNT